MYLVKVIGEFKGGYMDGNKEYRIVFSNKEKRDIKKILGLSKDYELTISDIKEFIAISTGNYHRGRIR